MRAKKFDPKRLHKLNHPKRLLDISPDYILPQVESAMTAPERILLHRQAKTRSEIDAVRRLFRDYEAFLAVDLCFQGFEEELAGLPGKYAPPDGALLLAFCTDQPAGCVALRKIGIGICEMKRLYVRPEFRGTGLGRHLAQEIIAFARVRGYARMRLDTFTHLEAAMHLYKTLGFRKILPYCANPHSGVVYLELDLKSKTSTAGTPTRPVRQRMPLT